MLIRKGAVRISQGELAVILFNLDGAVVLVKTRNKIKDIFYSLNHAIGSMMARSNAKELAYSYNYESLRKRILIPEMLKNASFKTEAPFCYRNLDHCLDLIKDLISIEKRFSIFAYLGQI